MYKIVSIVHITSLKKTLYLGNRLCIYTFWQPTSSHFRQHLPT